MLKIKKLKSKTKLFFWSEIKFSGKKLENYGDLLSKYIVEKITKNCVAWVNPIKRSLFNKRKKVIFAIGSILQFADKNTIVWGSGIISKDTEVGNATFLAVRGPETRNLLIRKGFKVPKIYGDPALLLPLFFNPVVKKKYKLGIIPHYVDFKHINDLNKNDDSVLVINLLTNNIEDVTKQIMECEVTVSSSLHGIIVSHAYDIPCLWMECSDKIFGDKIKYKDYLNSVDLKFYLPLNCYNKLDANNIISEVNKSSYSRVNSNKIKQIQKQLLEVYPFN